MNKDIAMELLAGELFEMVSLGWTDEEARADEDAFFERIGDYAEGLTKEEVWSVWENVIADTGENVLDRFKELGGALWIEVDATYPHEEHLYHTYDDAEIEQRYAERGAEYADLDLEEWIKEMAKQAIEQFGLNWDDYKW